MEKEYYTLTELTERWDFGLHDALYLAENNICRFWINLPESDAIRFRKESNNGLTYDLPLENCQAKGLLLLTTEDVRRIIIYKTANVIQLPCQDDMTVFVRLKAVRELTIDDVLILCKDKLRLEKELGFFDKKAKVKSADIRGLKSRTKTIRLSVFHLLPRLPDYWRNPTMSAVSGGLLLTRPSTALLAYRNQLTLL